MNDAELLRGLGELPPSRTRGAERWLTLHETSELIRRAGIEAGMVPEAEFKCAKPDVPIGKAQRGKKSSMKIDWVWHRVERQDKPAVLIEIEGRDVSSDYLLADQYKLDFHYDGLPERQLRVLVLFQLRYDYTEKGRYKSPSPHEWMHEHMPGVLVYTDEELMRGGVHELIARARALR